MDASHASSGAPLSSNVFDDDWSVKPSSPAVVPLTSHVVSLMKSPTPELSDRDYILGVVLESYRKAAMDALIAQTALDLEKKRHTFTKEQEIRAKKCLREVNEIIMCAICIQPMHHSHIWRCGHTFCRECTDSWRKTNTECPTCRNRIGPWDTANYAVQHIAHLFHGDKTKEQS